MGSTLGCAECHDHKFDPFTAKDFYQMAAFFADIEEVGVYGSQIEPLIRVLPDESKEEISSIQNRIRELRQDGGRLKSNRENIESFRAYLRERLGEWTTVEPQRVWNDCAHPDISGCGDLDLRLEEDGFFRQVVTGEEKPREAVQIVETNLDGEAITAVLLELFPSEGFDDFYLSEFDVKLLREDGRQESIGFGALVPGPPGNGLLPASHPGRQRSVRLAGRLGGRRSAARHVGLGQALAVESRAEAAIHNDLQRTSRQDDSRAFPARRNGVGLPGIAPGRRPPTGPGYGGETLRETRQSSSPDVQAVDKEQFRMA